MNTFYTGTVAIKTLDGKTTIVGGTMQTRDEFTRIDSVIFRQVKVWTHTTYRVVCTSNAQERPDLEVALTISDKEINYEVDCSKGKL